MSVSQLLRGCLFLGVIPLLMAAGQASKPQPAVAAKLCQSCHGAHGEGTPAAGIPRLAGQSADYLYKRTVGNGWKTKLMEREVVR